MDEFVVMPNHLHGIVFIDDVVPATRRAHGRAPLRRGPRSLGSLIAGFKSAATKRINAARRTPRASVWQRNYYEHVMRDERDLSRVRESVWTIRGHAQSSSRDCFPTMLFRRGARPCARRAAWVRRPNGHDARIQVRFAETPQPPPAWLRLWSDSPARMAADRRNQAGSPSGRIRGHAQSSSWDCFHRRRCSGNAAGARPCAPTARTPISRVIDCWVQISRYETH